MKIDFRTLKRGLEHTFTKAEQIASFWQKVERRGDQECWGWKASLTVGYGSMQWNGKRCGAHVVSYEIHFGKVPPGKCVLHKCNNRICTNPAHLKIGTHLDNTQDKRAAGNGFGGLAYGEDNPRSKLTALQVKTIRTSNADALTVSIRYGVTRRHIYNIRSLKSWKRDYGKGVFKWS